MFGVSAKLMAGSRSPNVIVAPFSAVALLLDFEEAAGATPIDKSTNAHVITMAGAAAIQRTTPITGGGSLQLTTAAADSAKAPSHAKFNAGQAKYTIDIRIRPSSVVGGGQQSIWTFNGAANQNPYLMILAGNMYLRGGNASPDLVPAFAHGMAADTPHLVSVVKNGTAISLFLDGVLKGYSASSGSSITSENKSFYVGSGVGITTMGGAIDDVRLTEGYDLYRGNFTPPTGPWPTS